MTALAFLLASAWRPERSGRARDWRGWLVLAAFYVALGAVLSEIVAE